MTAFFFNKPHKSSSLSLFIFSLISLWPTFARGDVVLSNLNEANYGIGVRFILGSKQAIAFETSSSSWQMTNFTFAAYSSSGAPSDFTLRLYTASQSSPYQPNGTFLSETSASASSLSTNSSSPNLISFSSLNWNLSANTKYNLEITSTSNFVRWSTNSGGFGSPVFTPLTNLIYSDINGWSLNAQSEPLAIEIQATSTAVPEPSTIVTFSLCILGVLIWRFIGIAR